MYMSLLTLSLVSSPHVLHAEVGDTDLNETSEKHYGVKINKCCFHNELVVDGVCRFLERYNQTVWTPQFKTEKGNNATVKYSIVPGVPECPTTQQRVVFDLEESKDKLNLLTDGQLRHLIYHGRSTDNIPKEEQIFSLHDNIAKAEVKEPLSFIYNHNKYCMDKMLITNTNITATYALVCVPQVKIDRNDTNLNAMTTQTINNSG